MCDGAEGAAGSPRAAHRDRILRVLRAREDFPRAACDTNRIRTAYDAAALTRLRLYLQLLRRWQSKNASDLFGLHDAATNHVLAIVTDSLDDQFALRHLLEKPPVSDILDVAVNDVEFVRFEVGGRCRFQLLPKARAIEQRRLWHAEHGQFASAEGKRSSQFYTPASIVKTLVAVLAPHHGKVYHPCCGSGGMCVRSERFVAGLARRPAESLHPACGPQPMHPSCSAARDH